MSYDVTVSAHGPIFDGTASSEVRAWLNRAVDKVTQIGVDDVHIRLHEVLRHPTGYYESHIRSSSVGSDRVIDDQRIIYGPWLEGVGSRNSPVTRFPGYFTFRLVKQALQEKVPEIVAPLLEELAAELNR